MFAKSIRDSVQPFLMRSEQLLGAVMAQNAGANAAALAYALRGPLATAKAYDRADRRMVIAVTSRRLLVFRIGGVLTPKVKALLGEAPIGEVDGIDVVPAGLAKAVTLRVRGTAIGIDTTRGQPAEALARALHATRPGG